MNTRKNKIIVICFILFLIVVLLLVLPGKLGKTNYGPIDKRTKLCKKIDNFKNNNSDFIVYIEKNNNSSLENDVFAQLSNNYNKKNIVIVNDKSLSDKCFLNEMVKVGLFEVIKNANTSNAIGYKNGEYVGSCSAQDYLFLEDCLDKLKIVKKKEIKETIDLEKFKEKIKGEYILFIIGIENIHRPVVKKNANEFFDKYNYDIINRTSNDGKQIYDYIIENYKIGDYYPQVLYFKDSKLVKNSEVFENEKDYKDFVKNINFK